MDTDKVGVHGVCGICGKETDRLSIIKWSSPYMYLFEWKCDWGYDEVCENCFNKYINFMNKERRKHRSKDRREN